VRAAVRARRHYFAPIAYEIALIGELAAENFGPILHVVRYDRHALDARHRCHQFDRLWPHDGLHTRLDGRVVHVADRAQVGISM